MKSDTRQAPAQEDAICWVALIWPASDSGDAGIFDTGGVVVVLVITPDVCSASPLPPLGDIASPAPVAAEV